MDDDQSLGVNDDKPYDDKPNLKQWQSPILRSIPLRETQQNSGIHNDGHLNASTSIG